MGAPYAAGPVWRIGPFGTTEVYLDRIVPNGIAYVSSRVGRGWAKRSMRVAAVDIFPDRDSARAEYRRRRQRAKLAGEYGLNFTTPLPEGADDTPKAATPPRLTGRWYQGDK